MGTAAAPGAPLSVGKVERSGRLWYEAFQKTQSQARGSLARFGSIWLGSARLGSFFVGFQKAQ